MEVLPKNPIIEYIPDTLTAIRKQYNLDGPGRMNEAIEILEEWLKKQEHFVVKTFPRTYLERIIINNKGSLEACKRKLDRACTFRTLLPDFYGNLSIKNYEAYKMFTNALLPKMTPDYGRVIIVKCFGNKFETERLMDYYKFFIYLCEYVQAHDYITGIRYLVDCRESDILEFANASNLINFKKIMDVSIDGYCFRIKGLHIISESKSVDYLVMFLKQVFSTKIASRIQYHKSLETIYDVFPKDILPAEYGGNDKSIPELRDDLFRELGSAEFTQYFEDMKKARTNEDRRLAAKFNEEYLGLPGTFRTLNVD
ncbi:alpha-tocopherol transfer protein-like [Aricia agestis]|uniref:alpha-tocopherol transfer protein-like n=1 Tax=Aricia agestis TaxID=91739 RepID=UPI001C20A1B6|nr:alpha-tocopherol transfer protein-like [Aricia agestis]